MNKQDENMGLTARQIKARAVTQDADKKRFAAYAVASVAREAVHGVEIALHYAKITLTAAEKVEALLLLDLQEADREEQAAKVEAAEVQS